MPTISIFYGITIRMYWADHSPPHFHASYGEDEAVIDIRSLQIIRGNLPSEALRLIFDWATLHRILLLEDWDLGANRKTPITIPPLD